MQPKRSWRNYCVKDLLPRTGLAVFWGKPKSGKSFFVFDLLMHVALGWDYRRHRVKQGPVVYVCLEGGRAFRKRREAFRQAKLKNGKDPPFYFIVNPLSLASDRKLLIEDIRRQLDPDAPAIVCIDTLNRSLEGSESSTKTWPPTSRPPTPSATPLSASWPSSTTAVTTPSAPAVIAP
jgi:RecA-family ATPase